MGRQTDEARTDIETQSLSTHIMEKLLKAWSSIPARLQGGIFVNHHA
jgi:hypothetical protein